MTAAKALEYRIIQNVLARQAGGRGYPHSPVVERILGVCAATVGLFVVASFFPELAVAIIASCAVAALAVGE